MLNDSFAGGTKRCLTCGAVFDDFMVLGVRYGRRNLENGIEAEEKALDPAIELTDRFIEEYSTTNWCELTGFDFQNPGQFQAFIDSSQANEKCTERVRKV
jgi:hypothetical protein